MESYFGGKNGSGTIQVLKNIMPLHKIYIEGYLGSGALIRNKAKAEKDIGIEVNQAVIDKYHYNARYIVINDSFLHWLTHNLSMASKDTFIYLDPPYLHSTRKSSHQYEFELSDNDHSDLLKIIPTMRCNIAISCYDNSLYQNQLKNWHKIQFQSQTRKGKVTETIYCNYNPDHIDKHDYSSVGNNFTDRQRIKRKIDRHVKKLLSLPVQEQKAILRALNESTMKNNKQP